MSFSLLLDMMFGIVLCLVSGEIDASNQMGGTEYAESA